MTLQEAEALARMYMPEDAMGKPSDWVVSAILDAYQQGYEECDLDHVLNY